MVLDVFGDVAFELCLGILAACGDEGAVMFGNVRLHIGKNRGKILALGFRREEQRMGAVCARKIHRAVQCGVYFAIGNRSNYVPDIGCSNSVVEC